MFHIDPNVNAAVERQAERLRAVRALEYSPAPERFAPHWGDKDSGPSEWIRRGATVALAAALPVVLIVAFVVVLAR